MKTNGPRIRLDVSCSDCEHHTTERYTCQGDSGREHYCNQPGVKMDNARGKFGARYIGETSQTPIWCPYYPSNIVREVERKNRGL